MRILGLCEDLPPSYHFVHICIILYTGNIDEEEVMGVMKLVEEALPTWTALEGYLNLYNYSKALKSVPGCGRDDGIHFEPVCNYQVFLIDII